jgi:hypothetical protein
VVMHVETTVRNGHGPGAVRWGVGRDGSPVLAELRAVVSAVNRVD